MFEVGSLYPPKEHQERIKRYRENSELIKGNADLLKKINEQISDDERLYISVNFAGLVCKKAADLMFGEPPVYSAGKEGSPEQAAIDRIVIDNALDTTNYEMAYGNAYRGDSFYKIKWAQEYRGVLNEDLDPYRVIIESQNAAFVFPETLPGNNKKIIAYHIAVPVKVTSDDKTVWELQVESHYPGSIVNAKYAMNPISTHIDEVVSWQITEEISVDEPIDTGVPLPLVVAVPNFAMDDSWQGIDDVTEHRPVLSEINHRLTQIASILDKHADPILTVPEGVLEEGPDGVPQQRAAYAKVFEVIGKDGVIPQYVTWDGQLDSAFRELDKLLDMFLSTAEMPPVALGKENAGTSGATGVAVKYRMGPLLSKIGRKRQYFNKALTETLYIAQLLEHAHSTSELDYKPKKPHILFSDGLPVDERELVEIMQIRTGGKATLSTADAIKRLDGLTDEQARQAVERIDADEQRVSGTVDSTVFNEVEVVE